MEVCYNQAVKNKAFDSLVSDAIYLCKDREVVSPYLFQRLLPIDLETAERIFDELQKLGLLVNVRPQEDDQEAIIADVNKEKLRELQTN